MASAFVSEELGFGLHVTPAQWQTVKHLAEQCKQEHKWFEVEQPCADGSQQLGLLLFDYGKKQESGSSDEDSGWWNNAKFTVHCKFVLDCLEMLYPDKQIVLLLDQSSGHMKWPEDSLRAQNLNFHDGGNKKGIHDTTCHMEDIGEFLRPHLQEGGGGIDDDGSSGDDNGGNGDGGSGSGNNDDDDDGASDGDAGSGNDGDDDNDGGDGDAGRGSGNNDDDDDDGGDGDGRPNAPAAAPALVNWLERMVQVDRQPPPPQPPPPPPPPAAAAAAPPPQRPPGMLRDDLVQYGRYPATNDPARYDNGGPIFRKNYIAHSNDAGEPGSKMPAAPPEAEWRGKAKGMLQILYERGWVDPSLKSVNGKWAAGWGTTRKRKYKPTKAELAAMQKKNNGARIAELVLNSHRDFREERSIVTQLFMERGHLVVPSPRYHPDVAGLGVEYDWGKAKLEFRRHINDLNGKHLRKNVLAAMGDQTFTGTDKRTHEPPLPLSRVRRFARRARTNRNVLEQVPSKEAADELMAAWKDGKLVVNGQPMDAAKASRDMQKFLDAIYKVVKTHRNCMDTQSAVCDDVGSRDADRDDVVVLLQLLESVGGAGAGQSQ